MKRTVIIVSILFLALQLLTSCTREKSTAKSMQQIYKENGVPVKIQVVEKKPITTAHIFHAVLKGFKESTASAKVADEVEKIHFNVGDKVEKDAVVVSFPVDNPAAQYNQAKVSYEHAKATLKRMKNLYESGGISLQEYENIKTQYNVGKANWEAVRQSVEVKAPISGIITQINVLETDNVKSGDKLFTVSQTRKLKAKLWVSENQIGDIHSGDKATATWQNISLAGKVIQVDMSLNTKMQAFGVVVEFDNPDHKVKSGVNAEIKISSSSGHDAVLIDRKNLIKKETGTYVFIAAKGKALQRKVELGKVLGLDVEIISGLTPRDSLIIEGQLLLKDGDKIKIVEKS